MNMMMFLVHGIYLFIIYLIPKNEKRPAKFASPSFVF